MKCIILTLQSGESHMMLTKLNEANKVGRKLIFLCTDGVNHNFFDRFPDLALGSYLIDVSYNLENLNNFAVYFS